MAETMFDRQHTQARLHKQITIKDYILMFKDIFMIQLPTENHQLVSSRNTIESMNKNNAMRSIENQSQTTHNNFKDLFN